METFINIAAQLIIPAIVVGVVIWVGHQVLPALRDWIGAHVDARTQELIDRIVDAAVRGAEAARIRAALAGVAFDAVDFAIGAAGAWLDRYGIDLDENALHAAILAALGRMREWQDPPAPPAPIGAAGADTSGDGGDGGDTSETIRASTRSIDPAQDREAVNRAWWWVIKGS